MKEKALTQLRDIKLPENIGMWPMAYGWYILFILVFAVLAAIVFMQYRRYLNNRPKKAALSALSTIKENYLLEKNTQKTATELTSLLKRFCFTYNKRKAVAPLYGKELETLFGNSDWSQLLTRLSYQKNSDEDLTPYFDAISAWIRGKHHV
jgi:hypothetical protein